MPLELTRRRFLGAAAGFVAAAALGDGFVVEPTAIAVTRHDLLIPGLARRLAGLRIACVTDVHLHRGVHAAARATLALLAHERPEIVALIGDIYNKRSDLARLTSWAGEARGTLATFATFGNWEHVATIDRASAERFYGRVGVEFLYNTSGRVRVDTAELTVVGIDDPVAGEPDVAAAVRGLSGADPAIWVLHAPGFVDAVPRGRFPPPRSHPRGPYPRRPDPPAVLHAVHTHGQRPVRGGMVPRYARAALRLPRYRNRRAPGSLLLPAGVADLHPAHGLSPALRAAGPLQRNDPHPCNVATCSYIAAWLLQASVT